MKTADSGQPEQMQQWIGSEEDRLLQLFAGETYASLTRQGSEEMIQL